MLLSKKLVVLFSVYLSLPSAWAQSTPQAQAVLDSVTASPEWKMEYGKEYHWATDQEAMTPLTATSANNCQKNPTETLKLMEEIEKKHLCTADLSYGECYALMMAGAAGGAAAAGSMTARKVAAAGAIDIGPEDIVCSVTKPGAIYSLLIPEAYATEVPVGKFCFIRSQETLTRKAEALRKKLEAEKKESMDKLLKPEQSETPEQAAKRYAKAEKEMIEMAQKYRDKIKAGGFSSNVKRPEDLIQKLDEAIKNRRLNDINSLMDLTSDSYFPGGGAIDREKLRTALAASKQMDAKTAGERAEQLANLRSAITNGTLSDETITKKLAAYGGLDSEAILKQRKYWIQLSSAQSRIHQATASYTSGLIDEAGFYKGISQAGLQASQSNEAVPLMVEMLKGAEAMGSKIVSGPGASSRIGELMMAARNFRNIPKVAAQIVMKSAAAAPGPWDVGLGLMGTFANGDCLEHLSKDTQQGKNKFYMAGLNYLKVDPKTCKPEVEYNNEFKNFMSLSPISRLKLARYNDVLCKQIFELAYKDSLAAKSEISCDSPGHFRVSEKANPQVQERLQREMAQAKLSAAEQAEYIKANSKIGYNAQVEVTGETYKFSLPQIAQKSCQNFSVQLASNTPSDTRGVCKPATNFATENIYEISQIAKCCAGDSVSYCDAFKSKFVSSTGSSGSGAGLRTDSVKTQR